VSVCPRQSRRVLPLLRISGGGFAAVRGRALQMSAETAAEAMTPDEWFKANGYRQVPSTLQKYILHMYLWN